MFTGIIEELGVIKQINQEGQNYDIFIESPFTSDLQVDQSVAHDGVCLTVVEIKENVYKVTAIEETLKKTRLKQWKVGDQINLERSLTLSKRIDGHLVQGHVDTTALCISKTEQDGSWLFQFEVEDNFLDLMVEKGSICINGTSLTIFGIENAQFQVAIIPFTYEQTNFHNLKVGEEVNIEFDVTGKYIIQYLKKIKLGMNS